jgi:hypothetical protein
VQVVSEHEKPRCVHYCPSALPGPSPVPSPSLVTVGVVAGIGAAIAAAAAAAIVAAVVADDDWCLLGLGGWALLRFVDRLSIGSSLLVLGDVRLQFLGSEPNPLACTTVQCGVEVLDCRTTAELAGVADNVARPANEANPMLLDDPALVVVIIHVELVADALALYNVV